LGFSARNNCEAEYSHLYFFPPSIKTNSKKKSWVTLQNFEDSLGAKKKWTCHFPKKSKNFVGKEK